MTNAKKRQDYFARPIRSYSYPNAAEPGYFAGRLLDGVTAVVTAMGTVTILMYLLTF